MSEENNIIPQEEVVKYDDDNIRHLSDMDTGFKTVTAEK